MKDQRAKRGKYAFWLGFNILLPMLPVWIKLLIVIFSNIQNTMFAILDSSELLYYNMFISVAFEYNVIQKKKKTRLDYWLIAAFFLVIVIDIVLLVLIYTGMVATLRIKIVAVIMSAVIPVSVCLHKYHQEVRA